MSIKTRLDKLEETLVPISAEAWRVADNAVARGLIAPEQREEFAASWKGFEAGLAQLQEVQS